MEHANSPDRCSRFIGYGGILTLHIFFSWYQQYLPLRSGQRYRRVLGIPAAAFIVREILAVRAIDRKCCARDYC